ncbi:cysteine desulfurase [Aureococcus anophagefferens]|nr:cysteine desulfurase [Aureococcus anophagefferens]
MSREGVPAYLDVQATSQVDPRVLDAMLPYLVGSFGNAHSKTHSFGWESEEAVETRAGGGVDRRESARSSSASGATESNNMSIKGVAHFYGKKKKHIVTTQTEHKASARSSAAARAPRARLLRRGQERGLRSGTLPTALCVGLGAAADVAARELDNDMAHIARLSKRLMDAVGEHIPVVLSGHPTARHPGNVNLSFAYVEGESLLMSIKNIANAKTKYAANFSEWSHKHWQFKRVIKHLTLA